MKKITRKDQLYRPEITSREILKVKVDFISLKNALSLVEKWVDSNKQYQITTPNPEHIVLAQGDYRFRKIINNSALAIADGVGIVVAAQLLNSKLQAPSFKLKRISGVDLMISLCKLAAQKNWRLFLLGGKSGVAEKAAANLKSPKFVNTKSANTIECYSGSQNIQNETPAERRQTIKRINNFKPDILFVAFGAPMQEKWIADNLAELKVKAAVGVGGAFDYLAGNVGRAPKIVRKIGLEWLWRLVCQPWRWRRQLRLVKFGWLVIKEAILNSK